MNCMYGLHILLLRTCAKVTSPHANGPSSPATALLPNPWLPRSMPHPAAPTPHQCHAQPAQRAPKHPMPTRDVPHTHTLQDAQHLNLPASSLVPHLCEGYLPSLAHVVLQVLPGGGWGQARHNHAEGCVVRARVGAPAVVPARTQQERELLDGGRPDTTTRKAVLYGRGLVPSLQIYSRGVGCW
jgi:hypothetical protein